jgi:hypothetical protein
MNQNCLLFSGHFLAFEPATIEAMVGECSNLKFGLQ